MKIWLDLTNSPHVNFFSSMIETLAAEHELTITCRPLANTLELLDAHGIPYRVVGEHYGKSPLRKTGGFVLRVWQLVMHLWRDRPDVAISHSSFYSPVVSRILGVRSIYLNDNEHAAGNVISFLCADTIMVPEFLSDDALRKQGAKRSKVLRYPGVKEGVYLWQEGSSLQKERPAELANEKKKVFIRPEPSTAQYYSGGTNFLDEVIVGLRDKVEVVVLPRDQIQSEHYQGSRFAGVTVLRKPMSLVEIAQACDLFIGAGGTMTREAAVIGIPTISVYQDDLLEVDRYLIERGRMVHLPEPSVQEVVEVLDAGGSVGLDQELLDRGREAYNLIVDTLLDRDTICLPAEERA